MKLLFITLKLSNDSFCSTFRFSAYDLGLSFLGGALKVQEFAHPTILLFLETLSFSDRLAAQVGVGAMGVDGVSEVNGDD